MVDGTDLFTVNAVLKMIRGMPALERLTVTPLIEDNNDELRWSRLEERFTNLKLY